MSSAYNPGDTLSADDPLMHYVYELVDDYGAVFYVGVTSNPRQRLESHVRRSPRGSLMAQKMAHVCQVKMRIVSTHKQRELAEFYERKHMLCFEILVNGTHFDPKQGGPRGKRRYQSRLT